MKFFSPFQVWVHFSLWKKILIAVILGIVVGLLAGNYTSYLKLIGNLFIHAIHMLVVPVVFTSIVCAVLSIQDKQMMRRVGLKALIIYAISMAIAASIGLLVASIIQPGADFHPVSLQNASTIAVSNITHQSMSLLTVLENIVPMNPIQAFAQENVIQILVFALLVGFAINLAGESGKPVAQFFQGCSAVVFKLAKIVMSFAPYGIFALIAWTFGEFGLKAMLPLVKFIGSVYLGCCLQLILVYGLVLLLFLKRNPLHFFKGIFPAMMFAFSTSSSAATLPLSMRCAEENLKIDKKIAHFLLPLGASFNLNGLSIYLSVATLFAANIYGIHLNCSQYLTVVATIVLTATGAAAIPGSAIIVMGAVMSAVGVPLGAVALIAGVDRLNDMMQTTTNVAGDIFATVVVASSENSIANESWQPNPNLAEDSVTTK